MHAGFPKNISEQFPGIPNSVDAAYDVGEIHFFKGKNFWTFNPNTLPNVKPWYPLPISKWRGIPDDLDDVYIHPNGTTFFFKDDQYYRFNVSSYSVYIYLKTILQQKMTVLIAN